MRSKAHIKSHPIHPILVGFPISFMTAAVVFDLLAWSFMSDRLWFAGTLMVWSALLTGIPTAATGLIDYLYRVPPNSSGKKRATQHMFVNAAALLLYALSLPLRDNAVPMDTFPVETFLTTIGLGLVAIGGWLGGTLVYRNQIGVDHRYANAGKWQEMNITTSEPGMVKVCNIDELKPGQMKLVVVNDTRVVIARTVYGYSAFNDRCSHKGGPLSDGCLIGGTVQCPWHGSQFDAATGIVNAGPAASPIRAFLIREERGAVFLPLPLQEKPRPEFRRAANI